MSHEEYPHVVAPTDKDLALSRDAVLGKPYSMFQGHLSIGELKLECHVLNTGQRVFTQRELVRAISGGRTSGDLKVYVERNKFIDKDLFAAASVRFTIPKNPTPANGSEATLLIELCDAYLRARDAGTLKISEPRPTLGTRSRTVAVAQLVEHRLVTPGTWVRAPSATPPRHAS